MAERRVVEQKSGGFGLMDILLPQLTIPVKGVYWLAKQLHEMADKEVTDKSDIQQQMLELQMRYELEEISDEEYQSQEEVLLNELERIRKYEQESR